MSKQLFELSDNSGAAAQTDSTAPEQRAAAQLQAQRLMLLGMVAGGYVHDLNNLLTVIEGGALLAGDDLPPGHEAHASLDAVRQASQTAGAMARQLLNFVRKQPLCPTTLDLRRLCLESLPLLERLLGHRLLLETSLAPDLWPVRADPVQVEQIMLNLLVNARWAMPSGGNVTLRGLNVRVRDGGRLPIGEYVCLEVADTGVGIAPELQPALFDPFCTGGGTPQRSGLGLAACRCIAQELGGAITVESALGQGSTFRLYLPRIAA